MSSLSFEQFIKTLKEELEYHRDGGTSYRQETAKLSIGSWGSVPCCFIINYKDRPKQRLKYP